MLLYNTNRISELIEEERIQQAANALIRLPSKPVLKALAIVWSITLVLTVSGIYAVRFAFNLPLPF